MRNKILSRLIGVVLTLAFIAGCAGPAAPAAPAAPPADAPAADAAPPAGDDAPADPGEPEPILRWRDDLELIVFGSADEDHVAAVVNEFSRRYGVRTQFMRLATGEVFTRIREEGGRPSADVWWGGTSDPYIEARLAGLLYRYDAENAVNLIDDMYRCPYGYWYGIYTGILGFMVNREEIERMGLEMPRDWSCLTRPEYQGLIAYANPGTAGTGRLILNTLVQMKGEEEAMRFFAELDNNVVQYTRSGGAPSRLVGPGEIVIAIGFLHDGVTQIGMGFDNIELIVPESGTTFEIGATAIFEGATNLEAAKMFIEFALTPEAQNIGQEFGAFQFLVVEGATQPQAAIDMGLDLARVNFIDYDPDRAARDTERLIQMWHESIQADGRIEE